jgi:hypothetical protein
MDAQSGLRQLRDANHNDRDLVGLCNETIRIIKNLKKEEAMASAPSQEAAKNLRAKLHYNMDWLEKWKRKKIAISS